MVSFFITMIIVSVAHFDSPLLEKDLQADGINEVPEDAQLEEFDSSF